MPKPKRRNKYPVERVGARHRKYEIDIRAAEYLSSMANRAHYDERCASEERNATREGRKLFAGWKRAILLDLLSAPIPVYHCEQETKKETKPRAPYVVFADEKFRHVVRIQGHACYLCGEPFTKRHHPTRDHVVPRSMGGEDEGNILGACRGCNNHKNDRAPFPCEVMFRDFVWDRLNALGRTRARRRVAWHYENPEIAEATKASKPLG